MRPIFVKGRDGASISVVDCIIRCLTDKAGNWPAKTFPELSTEVSALRGKPTPSTTIRCEVYRHPELFERTIEDGFVRWRLSKKTQKIISEA